MDALRVLSGEGRDMGVEREKRKGDMGRGAPDNARSSKVTSNKVDRVVRPLWCWEGERGRCLTVKEARLPTPKGTDHVRCQLCCW